jgi:hypothetical protein
VLQELLLINLPVVDIITGIAKVQIMVRLLVNVPLVTQLLECVPRQLTVVHIIQHQHLVFVPLLMATLLLHISVHGIGRVQASVVAQLKVAPPTSKLMVLAD